MTFNLFSRFILWLKEIFYIRPKAEYGEEKPSIEVLPEKKIIETTQPLEEKSVKITPAEERPGEVSSAEEKAEKVPLSEAKTIEAVPLPEEKPPEIPTEEGPVDAKSPEEKTPEVLLEKIPTVEPPRELEEEAKTKTRKPYKIKAPTKERKKERKEPPEDEKKPASPKQRKEIDLGRRHAKRTKTGKPIHNDEEDKVFKEREVTTRVESPYVEIDLDKAKVFFIIPKQQFKTNTVNNIPQQLYYKLELNGDEQTICVGVSNNKQGIATVEGKRIDLEQFLKNFKVVFPNELQGEIKTYSYNHKNTNLYVFVAIGNNRGRMHYLYGKEGKINPIPKRDIWILLNEDFELETEPDVIEETWIWEKYQPFRVNLKKTNELVIKNTKTRKEYKLPCEPTFSIEGQVIEDDFNDQMPLLIGETLKIKAPRENPYGWIVWIQNKMATYRIISESWSGAEPLGLKLPDDLPSECGEFQVDICQKHTRIPDETLFFSWLHFIKLNYPKELIIPDPHHGHNSETIEVNFGNIQEWELENKRSQKVEIMRDGSYRIRQPFEEDTVRFFIAKKDKPETSIMIQITIPRLKWKTSKQKIWEGLIQEIKRKELIQGQELKLLVKTNDFREKYNIYAFLEEDGQRCKGPVEFKRKGELYILGLNEFYDTIDYYKNELILRIEIHKASDDRRLGSVELIHFESKSEGHPKKIISPKQIPKGEAIPILLVRRDQAIVKCPGKVSQKRKGKGFSRREIIAAGININNIRCLTIPFDKRRNTLHDWNVKTLQSIIRSDEHAH